MINKNTILKILVVSALPKTIKFMVIPISRNLSEYDSLSIENRLTDSNL